MGMFRCQEEWEAGIQQHHSPYFGMYMDQDT